MNFQQLRSVREAVRQDFNLTDVSESLHTSQPGVSRQIRELEEEVGVDIFVRSGKRLIGLTPPGALILPLVEQILQCADNIRHAGAEYADSRQGVLSIAATHSQARYALPPVIKEFRQRYPDVVLHLHQGSPKQVSEMLLEGEADIGVATEAVANYPGLVNLPCYRWSHSIIVPRGHPLEGRHDGISLSQLSRYPIITYGQGYTGRAHIDEAFARAGLTPDIVMTAMDADVIKTYVELELGVGIVAAVAWDPERDTRLCAIDARHLFEINLTRLAIRRGAWLRGYAFHFIEMFVPTLTREVVERELKGEG
ncbi:CysB family HTH-type transcriptional regulator [Achromobacter sp. LC458]|uniref:CysB family HTH-type transcriptional regulator n=1 Tax=Achromobacter spanius TaxID=217203 RepID=A0A2S5GIK2_9BURK|nr:MULTISPECIES: CysB family HTH-type transcriptional regulator [Achromobacter]MDX3984620.1 CysB family HTH-type transcriptional regulator [Achromobacter sp.]PPA72751.1 CysB family HTH-type transcriptional regulator [Achromobacter spanius]QYJ19114.1 CysB family HTH-type transcriptional regulator [Achromobacter sp. ES-001]TRM49649.1 CysB family HTH-type transcriptional regulator [Achromobacter sp. LC458]HCQ48988.1 CysB family HTH-type transcriptional regulator [Achromobacter sp.]